MGTERQIAKAYVQIIPTTQGIKSELSDILGEESSGAGDESGKKFGSSFGAAATKVIAALGIGKMIKDSVLAGADLEQSLGGVETLFKDNADLVKQYADEAYQTAGMSANAYMETVTGFSASLLQGLNGDTELAAKTANMAIIDMSDNANKLGSDMESIQNAYQGFAKQNYTMLDNLKLGYGGTAAEMARLINDSGVLGDAIEVTAQTVNDVSFDKIIEAIHTVQEDMDITGTTAKEASQTITGSMNSVKAAFENLKGKLALGMDVSGEIEGLTTSLIDAANNVLPAISNVIADAPTAIMQLLIGVAPELVKAGADAIQGMLTGLAEAMPELIPAAVEAVLTIVDALVSSIPLIIEGALQLVLGLAEGIITALPMLFERLPEVVIGIVDTLLSMIPTIIEVGTELLVSLVTALPDIITTIVEAVPPIVTGIIVALMEAIPDIIHAGITLLTSLIGALPEIIMTLVKAAPEITINMITTLLEALPDMIDAGIELISAFIEALTLPEVLGALVEAVFEIIDSMIALITGNDEEFNQRGEELMTSLGEGIKNTLGSMKNIGKEIVDGLWEGLSSGWSWLTGKTKGLASNLLSSVKETLGIHSPSRLFRDEVGKMIDLGLAEGLENNTKPITDAMNDITKMTTGTITTEAVVGTVASQSLSQENGIAANTEMVRTMQYFSDMLQDTINRMQSRGFNEGGDIIIPVYIGTEMLDEKIIRASEVHNLRTGGR